MKPINLIWIVIIWSCGNSTNSTSNQPKIKPNNSNEKLFEYSWIKNTDFYEGKMVAVYGFVWLDTIQPMLPAGTHTIYERPNCFDCGEAKTIIKTEISVVMIEDSTVENTNSGPQWRLVKATGRVEQGLVNVDRFERSEFCYPDYINSGYVELSDLLIKEKVQRPIAVYCDGYIVTNPMNINIGGQQSLSLKSSELKKDIFIYLHIGNLPNQCEGNPNQTGFSIRDMEGKLIGTKKVRVFGQWAADILNVEAIELLK